MHLAAISKCATEGCNYDALGKDKIHCAAHNPPEKVDHPPHYNAHPSGVECVVIAEHMGFNLGNALKYLWRAGLKGQTPTDEDLRKAIWYIERERERLKKFAVTT